MSGDPQHVLRALDELEAALETFRTAYAAWLASESDSDRDALTRALAEAEARLDAARGLLANAGDKKSYP